MSTKLIGTLTLTSIVILCLLLTIILTGGEFFSAVNVQLLIINFTVTIVLIGSYLLSSFCPQTHTKIKLGIGIFGLGLITFSGLVSFNIMEITSSFNWLIALGILYVLLIQLQLLQWGNNPSLISKICAFIIIISNLFLVIFFIAQWRYSGIAIAIDIATIATIISLFIGVIANKKIVERV